MSTTGKSDDAGSPGAEGHWKNGYNHDCGLPLPLLVDQPSKGPWCVIVNFRASKNRFHICRPNHEHRDFSDIEKHKFPVAWIGNDKLLALNLVERFNGYEMARDFPVKV